MCCQHNDDNDGKSGRKENNRTYILTIEVMSGTETQW